MRITLVISYSFPPLKSTTYRTFYIFHELKKHSEKTYLITSKNRRLVAKNTDLLPTEDGIIEARTFDYRTIRLFRSKNTNLGEHKKEGSPSIWAYKLLNSFPFNVLFGEGGLVYILHGFVLGKRLLRKSNDALILSSFRPYSDHVIAFLLKLWFPKAKWVADFRDLHLDPQLKETYFPRFQAWCNSLLLSKADIVTTVSKGLAQHLKPYHPNIAVLRNGIGIVQITNHQPPITTRFTITYTGSMFRDLRKPHLLLEALQELFDQKKMDPSKVRIQYAGKDTATWLPLLEQFGLTSNFVALGNISHDDAIQLQRNAHVNLLLTYASPELKGNATGKLYEYLAAQRPVLLLINGCQDEELEEIFEETNAGLVAYNALKDKRLVEAFLMDKYLEWLQTGQVKPAISPEKLSDYRWENMLRNFLEIHFPPTKKEENQLV